MPHASTAAPSAPASSLSVAATTRITPERYSPQMGEPAQGTPDHGISTLNRKKKPPPASRNPVANNRKKAVRRRGGLSLERPQGRVSGVPLVGDFWIGVQDLARSCVSDWNKPHPEVRDVRRTDPNGGAEAAGPADHLR